MKSLCSFPNGQEHGMIKTALWKPDVENGGDTPASLDFCMTLWNEARPPRLDRYTREKKHLRTLSYCTFTSFGFNCSLISTLINIEGL